MVHSADCASGTAEKENLTAPQQAPLRKVFEDDPFIEGMMDFRQVAEHVIRRGGPLIRTTSDASEFS